MIRRPPANVPGIRAKCREMRIFPLKARGDRSSLRDSGEENTMANKRGTIGKVVDAVTDRLSDLLDSLAPQPEAVPIPVRTDDPRRR